MNQTHNADEAITVIEAVRQHGIGAFRAVGDNYEADQ